MNKICNFTNTYRKEDYPGFELENCTDISGTDMYCDEEAFKQIRERIAGPLNNADKICEAARGIHLIDSGNYHYMTRLFTSLLEEDYILVFFDNHTDMKPAMFDMLSCGSWAKEVLEKDENLQKLIMIGPPKKSMDELPPEITGNKKLLMINGEEATPQKLLCETETPGYEGLPVYISVDKDVLAVSEVKTNWDQGSMSLETLIRIINKICSGRHVIGADICGLFPASAGEAESISSYEKGVQTDMELIKTLQKWIKQ